MPKFYTNLNIGTHLIRQLNNNTMNVLVYAGPGTTPISVKHCVETFRLLLSPYYAVSAVNEKTIIDQPWEAKTTVLVIPGGADLPICRAFNGETNKRIEKFVKKGGHFIGICSGAYYASARCEFEVGDPKMEVSGRRELKFFPGTCRGAAYEGFKYNSEEGARAVELSINPSILPESEKIVSNYYNGGGMFVDAQDYPNVEILANYHHKADVEDGLNGEQAAVILCTVGKGKALLAGSHPEFTPDLLKESPSIPKFSQVIKTLKSTNRQRIIFLRACLKKMGLKVNKEEVSRPDLTPLFLTSFNDKDSQDLIHNLEKNNGYQIQNIMNMGQDKFRIHKSRDKLVEFKKKDVYEDPELAIKELFVCGSQLPPHQDTPYFDLNEFQKDLKKMYTLEGCGIKPLSFGSTFVYGEVVTSTSGLMDNNINFLRYLPSGLTICGTTQVLGKGRSGNYWVNPPGVLAASTLMKIPFSQSKIAPIVFIQYLSSLAYIRAILNYAEGYEDIPVHIKWPNDIYIKLPEYVGKRIEENSTDVIYTKIGGILVSTNVVDNNYILVVGAGLNLSNDSPTTSINSVVDSMNICYEKVGKDKRLGHLMAERLLAKYLATFSEMFEKFKLQGFKPFLAEYYKYWFHTDQIVTIQDQGNIKAQISGITTDWGMLMAKELDLNNRPTGTVFHLQPDGNSFDMFRGLISRKQ